MSFVQYIKVLSHNYSYEVNVNVGDITKIIIWRDLGCTLTVATGRKFLRNKTDVMKLARKWWNATMAVMKCHNIAVTLTYVFYAID